MRQTLLSIAILSALSLPGLASAEVGPFDTENRVRQPGAAPNGEQPKGRIITEVGFPALDGVRDKAPTSQKAPTSSGDQPELQRRLQSPRDPASGLPTGKR